jgi:hypothetical protein
MAQRPRYSRHSIAKANETITGRLGYSRAVMLRFAEISVCFALLIAGALAVRYLQYIMN